MATLADIGRLLADRRRALGITQQALASCLGVAQPQVARWERDGYAFTSLARVSVAAEALGLTVTEYPVTLAAETRAAYAVPTSDADEVARALARVGVTASSLAAFARTHRVVRLELFGSVLTDDFGPESDVDFLVTYESGTTPSLLAAVDYEAELSAMLRRPVDLITRASVERSREGVRKRAILESARAVYAAP